MIQHTTASDVAAEVQMMRSAFAGVILVVEGDRDCRIYGRFVDDSACKVIPAHGKTNTTGAMEILDRARVRGVLSIVDADFWHILGVFPTSSNIIPTDTHDIEVMMIESQALDVVLREYASQTSLTRFLAANGASNLREILFMRALPLGMLRLTSEQHCLGLKFKGIDYPNIVSGTSLAIDEKRLAAQIARLTTNHKISESSVTKLLSQAKKQHYPARQACSGHDLTAILAVAFRQAIARLKGSVANTANVEKCLRMSFDLAGFKKTPLYSKIRAWEKANNPYRVLQH